MPSLSEDSVPPFGPLRLDGAFPRRDHEDWQAAAERSLKGGAALDTLVRHTLDGLAIPLLGHASPVDGRYAAAAEERIGASRWDNRLPVLGDTANAMSAHAMTGLVGGVTSLELDLAASGGTETGTASRNLDECLRGVHLDMITLALRTGDDPDGALDRVLALIATRGLAPGDCLVELDADPIGRLARDGGPFDGFDKDLARLAALAARAAEVLPGARVVTVDTVVHHAAGASSCQELVAAIATATSYLDAMLDADLEPEVALSTLSFRLALDADIPGGVVKLRALERLWRHTLASAALPVTRPRIIVETSRRQQSRLAPWVNHLRNIAACTAAAIGGADVVLVHPHDRVDGQRPAGDADVADRVARNLPILLEQEGGLLAVDDAAGGSHAIESLTHDLVSAVWRELAGLQDAGGLVAALQGKSWQADVSRVHAARLARLAAGDAVRVGVNRYRHDGRKVMPTDIATTAGITATDDKPAPAVVAMAPVREASRFEALASAADDAASKDASSNNAATSDVSPDDASSKDPIPGTPPPESSR